LGGGRVWSGANWLWRELMRRVRSAIDLSHLPELCKALDDPMCDVMHLLDLATVPRPELERFANILLSVRADVAKEGRKSFGSPEFFEGFLERLEELSALLAIMLDEKQS
jgi:hypothetical protein